VTPYARTSTRLSRLRERENTHWKSLGDPRRVGQEAREHMQNILWPEKPFTTAIVEKLFGALLRARRRSA
jgi:hypothetical protein